MPKPDGPQFKYLREQDERVTPPKQDYGPIYGSSAAGGIERPIFDIGKSTNVYRNYSYRPNSPDRVSARLDVVTQVTPSITAYPHNYEYTDNWAKWAKLHTPPGSQTPLFVHIPSKIENTVDYLVGTRGARVPSMTMLGIAEEDVRRDTGVGLTPSDDLSSTSLRLTKNMIRRGVTKAPSTLPKTPTNSLDFWEKEVPSSMSNFEHGIASGVSEDEVTAGKKRISQIARMQKEKKQSGPKYTQLTLDGI